MAEDLASDRTAKRNAGLMEGKYLTFSMNEEEYGVGILTIKEIIGMMRITPVPQTPDYVKGVINLRGKVIPVIDLRLRFGMNSCGYTERTCIIVAEIENDSRTLQIGIVVDSVSEVMNIKGSDMPISRQAMEKLRSLPINAAWSRLSLLMMRMPRFFNRRRRS
ncbi:MAG: chemotaxis protein CheW [Syntrophobacteraceae bacterium]|jgi:purine-binding chemotaxis protein CheW